MTINEIAAKNIMIKSNLSSAEYVIDPYVGCSHVCLYFHHGSNE
jgi:DNA repair photolyase